MLFSELEPLNFYAPMNVSYWLGPELVGADKAECHPLSERKL
mgnify:CR=1 FL=1